MTTKIDIVQPIRLSIGLIKFLGLWRLDNGYNSIYRIYSYLLHFCTTFLTTALMLTSVVKAKTLEEFTDPLFLTFTMIGLSLKVMNILHLNSVGVDFVKQLETIDFRFPSKSPKELIILNKALRMFYIVAIVYTGASFAVLIFGSSIIAFGQKWVLPYPMWLPFEYRYESKYYWLAYGYQFLGLLVGCFSNVSLDLLQCFYLRSISLIYFVIGSRLGNIVSDLTGASDSSEMNYIFLERLKDVLRLHKFAKKLTIDCQRVLSLPIFVQVLLSAFVLCFTGYRLSSMSITETPGRFIEMIDFLFVMGLQIYLPCYYGNQITLEAGKLNDALFSSNWTVLPEKSRRLIHLYMEFLKEPIYVKAGKFFQIGIPTFSKTVNNAYSFFAVLIRVQK